MRLFSDTLFPTALVNIAKRCPSRISRVPLLPFSWPSDDSEANESGRPELLLRVVRIEVCSSSAILAAMPGLPPSQSGRYLWPVLLFDVSDLACVLLTNNYRKCRPPGANSASRTPT